MNVANTKINKRYNSNASNKPFGKAWSGIRAETSNRRGQKRPKNMLRRDLVADPEIFCLASYATCKQPKYWLQPI